MQPTRFSPRGDHDSPDRSQPGVASTVRTRARRWVRTSLAAAGLLGVVFGGAVTSAHAAPYEHFPVHFQGSFVFAHFCGDLNVRIDVDSDFVVVGRETGPNRLLRYTISNHGAETFTNLATGKR